MVLRLSPVWRVRSARVVGPRACTVWRIARRFARRSSSVLTPVGVAMVARPARMPSLACG